MTTIAKKRREARLRRHRRVRKKVYGTAARPRLAVYRSNRNLSVQLIDDESGRTIASATSLEADFRKQQAGGNVAAATAVGTLIAQRAKAAGITSVVFDRGGFLYHGRIAAIAEAARAAGLEF
jgi:large subunit ribosomal protein L18